MRKRCPDCQKLLRHAGETYLNFAHPFVGGAPLKALFWPGDHNGLLIMATFLGVFVIAPLSLSMAVGFVLLPGFSWMILSTISPKPLFRCSSCKTLFAGRRLTRYDASDDVYR